MVKIELKEIEIDKIKEGKISIWWERDGWKYTIGFMAGTLFVGFLNSLTLCS